MHTAHQSFNFWKLTVKKYTHSYSEILSTSTKVYFILGHVSRFEIPIFFFMTNT